jgi:hypothetical protein
MKWTTVDKLAHLKKFNYKIKQVHGEYFARYKYLKIERYRSINDNVIPGYFKVTIYVLHSTWKRQRFWKRHAPRNVQLVRLLRLRTQKIIETYYGVRVKRIMIVNIIYKK